MSEPSKGMLVAIGIYVTGAVIFLAVLSQCGSGCKRGNPGDIVRQDTVIEYKWDTVVIERDPIVLYAKADTIVYHDTDTVYSTPAFTSQLDTVINEDTIGVKYEFPRQHFSLVLRMAPDSIAYQQQTVYITKEILVSPSLWEQIGTHGVALVSGFAIGRLTK